MPKQVKPSWLKEHEASLLSLLILAVTTYLSLQHTLSPEIVALIVGGVSFTTVVLHGWNKALPVVPLASMETLVGQVMTTLLPQATAVVQQGEQLVKQAESSAPVAAAPVAPVVALPAAAAAIYKGAA